MQRDLTEFNKLYTWLLDHGAEYDLNFTRYDNENAYKDLRELRKRAHYQPIDVHLIKVYKGDNRGYFSAECQFGSVGSERGLIHIIGDIAKGTWVKGEDGNLTADEIIERIEHGSKETNSAMQGM